MKYKLSFKKDVRGICSELRREFFVTEYSMTIQWMNEDSEEDNKKTAASIPIDLRYLNFTVQVYPVLQKVWTENKDEFFDTLVHEFSHLLTEPLYDFAIKAVSHREQEYLEEVRERQTQRIANIISPFLKKSIIKKPKKKVKKNARKRK